MIAKNTVCALTVALLAPCAAAQGSIVALVSARPNGLAAGGCGGTSLSSTGRFVGFESTAQNVIAGGTVWGRNVYVHDRQTGETTLESRGPAGVGGNDPSRGARVSDDGRYVVFWSDASDLIAGDTNGTHDVFRRDRVLDVTERVSVSQTGGQLVLESAFPQISADGRYVAFVSADSEVVTPDVNPSQFQSEVFVRDMLTQSNVRVCLDSNGLQPLSGAATWFEMTSDARYVAFTHSAQLAPADTDAQWDVYVRDLVLATTTLIPSPSLNYTRVAISDDGRFVAFNTLREFAAPALSTYLHDRLVGTTVLAIPDAEVFPGALSHDGELLVARGNDGFADAMKLYTRATNSVSNLLVTTVHPLGVTGYAPVLSADGRFAGFDTDRNLAPGDGGFTNDIYALQFAPPAPQSYCTAKTNSLGCVPSIGSSGAPSLSSGLAFTITASSILNQKNGILFYGSLPSNAPFQGGTLCVAQPVRRTAVQLSNGSASGSDCSGAFSYDFNARIRDGLDAMLVPGATVRCQYWSRDPLASFGTSLTDALEFEISY